MQVTLDYVNYRDIYFHFIFNIILKILGKNMMKVKRKEGEKGEEKETKGRKGEEREKNQ